MYQLLMIILLAIAAWGGISTGECICLILFVGVMLLSEHLLKIRKLLEEIHTTLSKMDEDLLALWEQ